MHFSKYIAILKTGTMTEMLRNLGASASFVIAIASANMVCVKYIYNILELSIPCFFIIFEFTPMLSLNFVDSFIFW